MPELSIIVPIYNGEKYLHRCIDSILNQKYTDFELILIDDGSKDNSLAICNEYAAMDSRIVVHHKENEGLVAARKSGLSIAKGEYIGFVDCDDFVDDNMYSNLMSSVEKNHPDIVAGGIIYDRISTQKESYCCINAGFYDKKSLQTDVIPRMLIYSGFVKYGIIPGVVTKVFRRNILEKALPKVDNSITIGEDVAITAYSVTNADSLSIVNSAAYHYVQNDNSMVRVFNPERIKKINKLYSCISKIENESYQKQVKLYMCYLIFNAIASCIKKSGYNKTEMKKIIKSILNDEITVMALKQADISQLSFKNKFKVLLMKYKLIGVLKLFI